MPAPTFQLYAITDSTLMPNLSTLCHRTEKALAAGVSWLQYRDKSDDQSKRLKEACALKALCEQYRATFIINDDVKLAKDVGANGVHLGQGDGDIQAARKSLGAEAVIGSTCHDSILLAEQAIEQGASYVAFGRFFPSSTKPSAKPASLSLLQAAKAKLPCPVVAIGGITPRNAIELLEAGAHTLAVCHSLFADDEVEYRAKQFWALDKQL